MPNTGISSIVNFFSYFTILTNALVAVCATTLLVGRSVKDNTLTAVTVYITIVGIVYNLVLRFIWDPQGLQKITDELLHSVNPVLFLVFWIAFVPKDQLKWSDAFLWLIYPLVYSVYTIIHGLISNWYPYPFIDPNLIGWNKVGVNSLLVLAAFLAFSWLAIGFAKLRSNYSRTRIL